MNVASCFRRRVGFLVSMLLSAAASLAPAAAAPSFISFDNRLPNPDRPYHLTSGTAEYLSGPILAIDDLDFQAVNPAELSFPTLDMGGNWEFDSIFDVTYKASVGVGRGPKFPVMGVGTAHAVGMAPGGMEPRVFDTEMLSLSLQGLPGILFRESPTLRSSGVTTVEDACPVCDSAVPHNRISSFFDVFTEASFDNGASWTPANQALHVEQTPEPSSIALAAGGAMVVWLAALSRKWQARQDRRRRAR